jgi:hypothetical protein
MSRPSLAAPLLFALCAACAGGPDGDSREERLAGPWREIEGESLVEVLPRDGIPAIDDPTFVSADEADEFLAPDETVLGVVGRGGTARAYSAVNDVLDGDPIAATW